MGFCGILDNLQVGFVFIRLVFTFEPYAYDAFEHNLLKGNWGQIENNWNNVPMHCANDANK
ncbi:MAG: hypothetical protein K0S24_656 [Sphingobacterium sp.]|jgi:hypothetical protein|nr:hypothetical protein [Sphingobacterium sp.]